LTDPLILVAGLVALGVVAASLLWPRGQAPAIARPAPRPNPGRALIDNVEELGRDGAGRLIAERLGAVFADDIAEKLGKGFARPSQSPPGPNP
jgi:hypothetical protein